MSAGAGVLVLHAWWGLNADVRAAAERLRREGYSVEFPDLYDGQVATTRERAMRVGIVGWSLGAFNGAQLAQAHPDGVAAYVGYYGGVDVFDAAKPMPPVLAHYAETDEFESLDEARRAERDLLAAGRDAKLHVYPGTKHWFDEPSGQSSTRQLVSSRGIGRAPSSRGP